MSQHNEYLKKVESFLDDLEVIQKSKILAEIYQEIQDKPTQELKDPLSLANEKRTKHGLIIYKPSKKFSMGSIILKTTAIMTLSFIGFLAFLVWKFTPIIKIDEKENRVIILGGLIDIDGQSGKFKFFDQYHFSHENFSNDFQANINLDEEKDEVLIGFKTGTFNLKTSNSEQLKIDCKLASPPENNTIQTGRDHIRIDFSKISGLACNLDIPVDKKITIEGDVATIKAPAPEYNLYVELNNGKVFINPGKEIDYNFSLNISDDSSDSYIGNFESAGNINGYEIRVNLSQGAIIRK